MRTVALFSLCSTACLAILLTHDLLPEYGRSDINTIAISIYGDGISRPGVYHVKREATLVQVILAAGPPPGRKYIVWLMNSPARDPYRRYIAFDRSKRPVIEPIALLNGDEVVFWEKKPNKPPEQTHNAAH